MARSPRESRRRASSLIGLDRLPALSGGLRLTGEERGEIETVSAQPRRLVLTYDTYDKSALRASTFVISVISEH